MKAIILICNKVVLIVSMILLPVTAINAEEDRYQHIHEDQRVAVEIPFVQQNRSGVATVKIEKRQLTRRIRTVGIIKTDQTREAHVHSRINGWIEKIRADYVGKPVKMGDVLYELYSPDLVTTQEEYLHAVKQGSVAQDVATTALNRLRLWGVPAHFIDQLIVSKQSRRTVGFVAPINGIVVDKQAIQGMYVTPEMQLYYLADLSQVWVMVTLYESDLSIINVGDPVNLKLPYDPTKKFTGKINYIYPEIDINSRTSIARVEIKNSDGFLRPGMFIDIEIIKQLEEFLVLPVDAVIDTGKRSIVFVKTHQARFEPREVDVGLGVDGWVPILKGVNLGEDVIINANFLIDAESKLQAVLQQVTSTGNPVNVGGHGAHGGK